MRKKQHKTKREEELEQRILELEKSVEQLQIKSEILDKLTAVCAVFDNNGDCIYVNPYTEKLLEYKTHDLLGDGIWTNIKYIGVTGNLESKKELSEVCNGNEPLDTTPLVLKIINPSGNICFLQMQRSLGANNIMIQSGFDITEQILAKHHLELLHNMLSSAFDKEKNLATELQFKSDILEQTTSMCTVFDTTGNCIYMNPYTLKLLNLTAEEVLGNGFWERVQYRTLEGQLAVKEDIVAMITGDIVLDREEFAIQYSADGGKTYRYAQLHPTIATDGSMIHSGFDITEAFLSKQALQEEMFHREQLALELQFKSDILEQTTSVCIVFNKSGECVYINPYTRKLLGLKHHEILDEKFLEQIEYEVIDTQPENGNIDGNRMRIISDDNAVINMYTAKYRANDSKNIRYAQIHPTIADYDKYMINSGFDVTDLILTKQRLEIISEELAKSLNKEKELNELKTKFVSMIAHEYRDPLTGILSTTEVINESLKNNDINTALYFLPKITKSVLSLSNILQNVLVIGAEEVNNEVHFEYTDIVYIIKDTIMEVSDDELYDCSVKFKLERKVTNFYSDEKSIKYILENLITNAMKYTKNGKDVRIFLRNDDENIYIEVQDKGIGIPQKDLKFLFEAFFRASNVGNIVGSGLGLHIIKQSVEKLFGSISVESEEGIGTTFCIVLPKDPRKIVATHKT